jgi:putative restriction endonuclease
LTNQFERAYRAWPILTRCAKKNEPITYGQLALEIGVHHRAISFVLGIIQDYCLKQELPPLTILVVNASTKKPGDGFIASDPDDLDVGFAEVHAFSWDDLINPFEFAADGTTIEDLIKKILKNPTSASDVLATIKTRGMAQALFRKMLLQVYDGQCAFCGLSFEAALEASHIVPWNEASARERLDPQNGLLLCATHHSLFDTGYLTVNHSGLIEYYDPQGKKDGDYSTTDRMVTVALHRKHALLPKIEKHRPSAEALAYHHRCKFDGKISEG